MPNIRLDLDSPIYDGQSLTFKSPADCSAITGLIVYYPNLDTTVSKVFQFADAHGNNIGDLDLFASDSLVKVILDIESSLAFVQNADTNAYLERRLSDTTTITLLASGWVDNKQTVTLENTDENTIVFSEPIPDDYEKFHECGIRGISQGDNSITYMCTDVPEVDLSVNLATFNRKG